MRRPPSPNTERARPAQPLEMALALERTAGDEPARNSRNVVGRTGALTGHPLAQTRRSNRLDEMSACGTVPSEDRLALPSTRSGFGGRVLVFGHAVGEPLDIKSCTTAKEGGDEPLDAPIGVAQWQADTTADEPLAAAGFALSSAKESGGVTVAGAGDVAVGVGRGVVGALVLPAPNAGLA